MCVLPLSRPFLLRKTFKFAQLDGGSCYERSAFLNGRKAKKDQKKWKEMETGENGMQSHIILLQIVFYFVCFGYFFFIHHLTVLLTQSHFMDFA